MSITARDILFAARLDNVPVRAYVAYVQFATLTDSVNRVTRRLDSYDRRLRLVEDQSDRQDAALTEAESRLIDVEDRLKGLDGFAS